MCASSQGCFQLCDGGGLNVAMAVSTDWVSTMLDNMKPEGKKVSTPWEFTVPLTCHEEVCVREKQN